MMFVSAFNNESRLEIKKRSNGRSELDSKKYDCLMCGHLNHDKKNPAYNSIENGMRLSRAQELAYHMMHTPNPEVIGMSRENNNRAIQSGIGTMIREYGKTYEEVRLEVGEALMLWERYLEDKDTIIEPVVEFEGFG